MELMKDAWLSRLMALCHQSTSERQEGLPDTVYMMAWTVRLDCSSEQQCMSCMACHDAGSRPLYGNCI
jgi:hypothetical protein